MRGSAHSNSANVTLRNSLLYAILASSAYHCTRAPATFAQGPIRVEIDQVLHQALMANDAPLFEDVAILDLTSESLHLFQDGIEQKIENLTVEHPIGGQIHDTAGFHYQFAGTGGGRWSSPDFSSPPNLVIQYSIFLIAYSPPVSPEGTCHQIKVTVDRAKALVLARSEYCNVKHSARDPLKGTIFGQELENDLAHANTSVVQSTRSQKPAAQA